MSIIQYMLQEFNPLVPSVHKMRIRIGKISIPKIKGMVEKISFEHCVYELADESSLSYVILQKSTERIPQILKCQSIKIEASNY